MTHLQGQVNALDIDVFCRPVDLTVAVLLKLAHGDILAVAAAVDQAPAGDDALVVV